MTHTEIELLLVVGLGCNLTATWTLYSLVRRQVNDIIRLTLELMDLRTEILKISTRKVEYGTGIPGMAKNPEVAE